MSLSLTLQSYLVQDTLDQVPTRSHGTPFITTLHRCPVYEPTASCPARTIAPASRVMWCGATVRSPRETSSPLDYIHLLANYYVVGCNTLRRHHAHMPIPYLSPSCRSNTVPVLPVPHTDVTSEGRRDRVRQESHRSEEEDEELSVSPIPHPVRHRNTTTVREDTRSEHNIRVSHEPPPRLVERTAVLSQEEEGGDDEVHVRRTAARSRSSCRAQRRVDEGSRDDEQVTTSPRSSFSPSVPRPATMTSAARRASVQTRQPSAVSHSSERSSNNSNNEQACSEEEHTVFAGVLNIATSVDSPTAMTKMMMMATTRWTSDAEEEMKKTTKEQQDAADTKEGSEASELRLTSQSHSLAPSEVTVSHGSLQQALLPTQRAKSHCTTTRAASVTLHEFYSRCYNDFMQRQRSHEAYGCRTSQETHHRSDGSRRNSGSDSMSSLSIACTASMSRVSRSAPRLSWAPPRHDQYYYHNTMNTVTRAVTTIHNGTNSSTLPASRSASRETCSMPSSIAASHTCSETMSEGEQACLRHRRAQSVNNLVAELGLTSSRQRYSECYERRVVCTMLRYSEESAAAMQENRPSVQLQQQQHRYSCGAYPPRQPSTSRPTIQ